MDLSFTNKIKFIFNKNEKINTDFDFYKFQNEKDYFENNFLKNNNSLDILSVVYTFGNTWYVMFKKDTDIFELKRNLNDNIQCEKILYEQISYENIKYQILLNYIPKISKNSDISNALGRLYYFVKQDGKCVRLINFEINYQNILTFKIKSFYPVSKDYKITKSTIFIHPISKKVFDKNVENSLEYHEKSFKKASVQFLSIENLEKFKKSKCYFLKRLLDDIKKHLKDYLEFEFLPYENWENKNLNKEFKDYEKLKNYKSDEVKTLFRNYKLIINNLENEAAKELEKKLKEDLLKLFNPNASKILELNIIYSKEYCKENNLKDKYKAKIHIQHICIDKINEKNYNNTLSKIIQELLIKKDLIEKRINLVNEKQDMKIIYIHKENKEISFHSMLIYKNMKFDFLGTNKQAQESLEAFIRSNIKFPDEPKLAIRVGDKLSLISKTELKILPDIKNIYEKLSYDTKCIKNQNLRIYLTN